MQILGPKKTIGSSIITISIVFMLILSQPVSSISLNLLTPTKIVEDTPVKITSEVIIKNIEWVNITSIKLEISREGVNGNVRDTITIPINLTKKAVILENLDLPKTESNIVNITVNLSTNAEFGQGFGYAYVFSGPLGAPQVNGSEGTRYGYGYSSNASVDAIISHDIFWIGKSTGKYTLKLSLEEGEDNMVFSTEKEITVESRASSSSNIDSVGGNSGGFGGITLVPTSTPEPISPPSTSIPLPIITKTPTPEPTITPELIEETPAKPETDANKPALVRTDIILTSLVVISALSVLLYIYYRR